MGVFHHHNDMRVHNDCQICTIQNSLADFDTPVQNPYFTKLDIKSEETLLSLKNLHSKSTHLAFQARAPPQNS